MASEDLPVRSKRSQSKKKSEKEQIIPKKTQNKWVFLMKDNLISDSLEGEEAQSVICRLRHPRRDEGLLFLVSPDKKSVHEINSFKEKHRSWFVGNTVHSDGQIFLSTPVDPVFLVLPYLINAASRKQFMTLDQIVVDEEFNDCHKLLSCSGLEQLCHVADVKDIDDDLKVFRYNSEKTLSWLQAKTEAAADVLREKAINIRSGGSHSAMFIRSNKTESTNREEYIEFAFGIISEYLSVSLGSDLKNHLGIKEKQPPKQETTENEPPPSKKSKTEDAVLEDYSLQFDMKKEKSTAKLTPAQKKLSKVDKKGMKSISSFFSKKS